MSFARHRLAEIDHFATVLVDQQEVFVGVRLFLAAVVFLLLRLILGPWSGTFRAINDQVGATFLGQRTASYLLPPQRCVLGSLPSRARRVAARAADGESNNWSALD